MTVTRARPPGPPLPRGLQGVAFGVASERFLEACRRRYGNVVRFRTLSHPEFFMVFDPELVKQVLRASTDRLPVADERLRPLLGERSLLALGSAEHLERRRLMAPGLHGDRLKAHARFVSDATDRAIDTWPVGKRFAVHPSMRALTVDVIAEVVLGPETSRRDELRRLLIEVLGSARARPRLVRRTAPRVGDRRALGEFLAAEVRRRRDDPAGHTDVLSALSLARDTDDRPLTNEEIVDHVVFLLIAGAGVTATTLAWAIELLLRHPGTLERLEKEFAADEDSCLDAVLNESLRLHPVTPQVRRVVRGEAYALGPYLIPPGAEVWASLGFGNGDLYPDPGVFRPERFLNGDRPRASAWMPFGGGVHRCIGASLATLEMGIVLRRVLERTRLEPVGRPARPVMAGIARVPARGVRVVRR